jgi:hypothetical protein
MVLQSVIFQTHKPKKIIIIDDSDKPIDMRTLPHYRYLFQLMDFYHIEWSVRFGAKKGQHYSHQMMNNSESALLFRIDDDTILEPDVLEKLTYVMRKGVGAVGGSILTPPISNQHIEIASGKIEDIYATPNKQWYEIKKTEEVDHLHCSFLYRAGIVDYELNLSKVAHREETLFTYGLKKAGYSIWITPCITWHLRNPQGGIRDGVKELYDHDEKIFQEYLSGSFSTDKLIVLDNGIGDHLVFTKVLPDIKEKYGKVTIACCYPELFEGENCISIAQAKIMLGNNIDNHNVYKFCWDHAWKDTLENAFRKLYL